MIKWQHPKWNSETVAIYRRYERLTQSDGQCGQGSPARCELVWGQLGIVRSRQEFMIAGKRAIGHFNPSIFQPEAQKHSKVKSQTLEQKVKAGRAKSRAKGRVKGRVNSRGLVLPSPLLLNGKTKDAERGRDGGDGRRNRRGAKNIKVAQKRTRRKPPTGAKINKPPSGGF